MSLIWFSLIITQNGIAYQQEYTRKSTAYTILNATYFLKRKSVDFIKIHVFLGDKPTA